MNHSRHSLQHLVAFLCFFASGFAGLIYEVTWIRQATLLLGATTFAVSAVLSAFFSGLAAGSYLFGRISRQTTRPLRLFAWVEIGIGLFAFLSPYTFDLADSLYGFIYRGLLGENQILLFLSRLILVAGVVFPPSFLMGGTLPLFCRRYVLEETRIARHVGFLYGGNTLGAALGCLCAGFLLLPEMGISGSIHVGVAISLIGGLTVLALPISRTESPTVQQSTRTSRSRRGVYWLFFAVGFVALGIEVLWTRYLGLLIVNTVYTYTITLSVVLVGIVLGSLIAARFDGPAPRARYFGVLQVLTGIIVLSLMMLSPHTWRQLGDEIWIYFLLLLPPSILGGAAFPLAVRMVVLEATQTSAGTGRMAAVNTFGGILGSLVFGFLCLPLLGLQYSLLIAAGLNLAVGITAWLWLDQSRSRLFKPVAIGVSLLAWILIPLLSETNIPSDFLGEGRELIDFQEGYGANLAVVFRDGETQLEIDRWWQGSDRKTHQIMSAHVPMLLHADPKRILVVGLGTGQTSKRFLMYPIHPLACVDIEPTLFPFIRKHFQSEWMDDPKVKLIQADGRNYLRHSRDGFDIISLELGEVFRPGIAYFYTTDFYSRIRNRLEPNGLLVQFVPLRFLTEYQFQSVAKSFLEAFPQSVLWYNTSELLLVGFSGDRFRVDPDRIRQRLRTGPVRKDLEYSHWGGQSHWLNQTRVFLGGFLMGPRGLAALAEDGEAYRDNRPVLDYETIQNYNRPDGEWKLVEALSAHLEPLGPLLAEGSNEPTEVIEETREKNIREMIARISIRKATDLMPSRNHAKIAALANQAISRLPDHLGGHSMLAEALMQLGRFEQSSLHFDAVLKLDPDNARALDGRAVTLHQLGRLVDAIPFHTQALKLNPQNALARNGIAIALHRLGRQSEAIPHYQELLVLRPDKVDVHANLGAAYAQTGKFEEARTHLEKAVRLLPNHAGARRNLAQVRSALESTESK